MIATATPYRTAYRSATVIGAARSGLAASRLLASQGTSVFLSEYGPQTTPAAEVVGELEMGAEFDGHTGRALEAEVMVLSPGVPATAPVVQRALAEGMEVISELELASRFNPAPCVAVTGSNGKTTTTSLLGHVFEASGRKTWVAGNIGTPLSAVVTRVGPDDVVVLEVSSFQLDFVRSFRPDVAILLNVTPDHLDRYGGRMDRYAEAKFRIARHQTPEDVLIANLDDERIRSFAQGSAPSRTMGITLQDDTDQAAAWIHDDQLVLRINDFQEVLMRTEELALRGKHNLYNSLAAAVAARVTEVRSDLIRESLATFEGVPHRLETVRELDGVRYINDSKATNVNAVWYALESLREPVVLIAGGRDKGNDYGPLAPLVKERVRVLIALGESAEKVEGDLGPSAEQCYRARSLQDAIEIARVEAKKGEVVLLSPACASFDQFENFEARGDAFKRMVANL